MSNSADLRKEKIEKHCSVLADLIEAIRPSYRQAEKQQKAFIETIIGAAIWYIPKPLGAWTGYMSREVLKAFHPNSGISDPKFSEEHVYPRKVTARLLLEIDSLTDAALLNLFITKYGRLHYITPDENKIVTKFQKDDVFLDPDTAYLHAKITLVLVAVDDFRKIKKRDASTIEKYL
jgi:hypothetical protein